MVHVYNNSNCPSAMVRLDGLVLINRCDCEILVFHENMVGQETPVVLDIYAFAIIRMSNEFVIIFTSMQFFGSCTSMVGPNR